MNLGYPARAARLTVDAIVARTPAAPVDAVLREAIARFDEAPA